GGSALTSFRDYYDPEGEGAAALKAKNALSCVMNQSEVLTRANPDVLNTLVWKLDDEINSARIAQSLVTGSNAQAAADATTKAIDAATAAKSAIQTELAAIRGAPETISDADRQAVSYVDTKFHRSSPGFQDVGQAVSQGIDFATSGATKVADARAKLEGALKATSQQQGSTGDTKHASPSNLGNAALTQRQQAGAAATSTVNLKPGSNEAQPKPTAQPSAAAAARQNVEYASSLVSLTEEALDVIPQPAYSAVNSKIAGCVAGM
ncbi:MAG TPA: hypothetical protein VKB71_08785, partial [Rhizomicrobium sp.]|nr:hypothetical protein [Rhizomicrobium sp.]